MVIAMVRTRSQDGWVTGVRVLANTPPTLVLDGRKPEGR